MQKVVSVNLNGNAYQLEEGAYEALVAYLDAAQRQLKDNPDRTEIVADLEQAIADKCQRHLAAHKTVVTSSELRTILDEMGPVDGGASASASTSGTSSSSASTSSEPVWPRRLYRISDGAIIAGVCNGIGAYIRIDPTIVRVIFVVLLFLTKGVWALAYFVLAFVLPQARTSEERAAAFGKPFNAQELIDRAKQQYRDIRSDRDSRREWRRRRREWRRQWRYDPFDFSRPTGSTPPGAVPPSPASYGARIAAGFMVPVITLISVVLFWGWLFAIFSVVTRQEVLGRPLPEDVPLWVAIVVLILIYQAVAWPLHLIRRSAYYAIGGPYYGTVAAFDALLSVGFVIFGIWVAFHYLPEVREFLQQLPAVFRSLRDSVVS
jgi:phage shock protein PspC (stress-responsive transcriptional regulator)